METAYANVLNVIYSFIRISAFVCGFILLLICIYTLYIVWIRRKYSHLKHPPYKNFFIANGTELASHKLDQHLVFIEFARTCGEVYCLHFLHTIFVMVASPRVSKELLMNSKFPKSKTLYKMSASVFGRRFLGNGLATNVNHEDWKKKRQAVNPAFHRSVLDKLVGVFNEAVDRLLNEIDTFADSGKSMSLLDLLHCTTLDVIGQAAFSFDIGMLDNSGRAFTRAIYMSLKGLNQSFTDPLYRFKPWNWSKLKEYQGAAELLRRKGESMLKQRIDDIENGRPTPDDILNVMIMGLADKCTTDELIDEIITMFVAGQETTANAVSFLFMELGRHPEMMEKLCSEVDQVVATKNFIDLGDLPKLEWVTAGFKEALRLYPPAGGTIRETYPGMNAKLGGYNIPDDTIIMVSFYAIHYLYHKDGFEFRPQRFLNADASGFDPDLETQTFTYMPFSMGQRSCIGRYFALMESQILISKMLQRYEFQLDPEQTFRVENAGTFKPADGAHFYVKRR